MGQDTVFIKLPSSLSRSLDKRKESRKRNPVVQVRVNNMKILVKGAHVFRHTYFRPPSVEKSLIKLCISVPVLSEVLSLPAFFWWEIGISEGRQIRFTYHDSTAGVERDKNQRKTIMKTDGKRGCG